MRNGQFTQWELSKHKPILRISGPWSFPNGIQKGTLKLVGGCWIIDGA